MGSPRACCSAGGESLPTLIGSKLPPPPAFIPVALPAPACLPARQDRSSGRIEIELAGGRRIRVDAAVDVGVLKQIVDALEGQ